MDGKKLRIEYKSNNTFAFFRDHSSISHASVPHGQSHFPLRNFLSIQLEDGIWFQILPMHRESQFRSGVDSVRGVVSIEAVDVDKVRLFFSSEMSPLSRVARVSVSAFFLR